MPPREFLVQLPEWVAETVPWSVPQTSPDARMTLAIALARENVARGSGGPFAALVFDGATGLPIAAGVNLVERGGSAMLHAEVVALMLTQASLRRYALSGPDHDRYILTTSCEPCAMCLGAILWSGVRQVESGAARADAERAGFDEGPVFPGSYAYLETRGVRFMHEVRRTEAAAVITGYRTSGGIIYNG